MWTDYLRTDEAFALDTGARLFATQERTEAEMPRYRAMGQAKDRLEDLWKIRPEGAPVGDLKFIWSRGKIKVQERSTKEESLLMELDGNHLWVYSEETCMKFVQKTAEELKLLILK